MDLSHPSAPRVLFVAPELAPLTKTGGLGDVCGALPRALREQGVDVRVLVPGYASILAGSKPRRILAMDVLGIEVGLLEGSLGGVPLFALDAPGLYVRPGGPYASQDGADWPDNPLRFGVLSRAASLLGSEASPLTWRPNVVHCNDWPTALAAVYQRLAGEPRAASLLTVHNLAFQGNFERSWMERLGLPPELFGLDGVEFHGRLSFLKGGLAAADLLNTVSPTYAREIQGAELGCGLDGLLRSRSSVLLGIANGIDELAWNPRSDPHLARCYGPSTLADKAQNKAELQRRMNLPLDPAVPLMGQVGRLTEQKGVDVLLEALPELAKLGQIAVLGAGDARYEAALRNAAGARVAVRIGFDESLAHLIEGGADLFLMPSRYEPCGLNQMYSQRYGTPPVVRATGGLRDTVEDGVTGFVFERPDAPSFIEAVKRAVAAYERPAAWRAMQQAGMARDFSWNAAARRYADLYLKLATPARR